MFDDWVPNTDATVVTRVLEAGATILGKGVCENMCLWGSSYSAATGPIDNFYAPGYSAGGSSSGTAVLVARGDVDFGIGGDQGGSIRMPASANGIVGLKPTHGLVPYTAIAPLESIIDHTGPMTKTVLENALLLRVLAGSDGIDDRQQSGCPSPSNVPDYSTLAQTGVKGLKVGIISETLDVVTSDPRVSELVVRAAKEFEGLGATVEDVNAPMHLVAPELWMVIERINGTNGFMGKTGGRRGMYLNDLTDKLAPFTQEKLDKAWPSVTNTIVNGVYAMEHLPPSLYGKAVNLVRKLKDEYDALLETYDVLICPTLPWVPKKFPENPTSPLAHMGPTAGMTFNTNPFNLSGHPALSLPVGFLSPPDDTSVKIPIGMQIIGKWYDEATVYKFAYAWESSHDWKSFA
ncbi:hypothetical protein MNV49_002930 [Pseudohyphozyma bogoriensis]|nr:hypothetical protein MNV49_002930 [Pseudohyphozyma bogoriensis]